MKRLVSAFVLLFISFFLVLSCSIYYSKLSQINKNQIDPKLGQMDHAALKAHMLDGSMIVYRNGISKVDNDLVGPGLKYDLTRENSIPVTKCPLDSIAYLEYYGEEYNTGAFLTSVPPVGFVGAIGISILAVAIFGSCPTIYSTDGVNEHLEAEEFSYSISKMYEMADLDRLNYGKALNGYYYLNVKNEALETHYINSLNLVIADYPKGYESFPDENQNVLLVKDNYINYTATSSTGKDVTDLITSRDGRWYQGDQGMVKQMTKDVKKDWINFTLDVPKGAKKAFLAFKIRNSLFNTVLLYDVMLARQGLKAAEWIDAASKDYFYGMKFVNWYQKYFGMHLKLFNGMYFEEVQRINDTGPITWHETSCAVPVEEGKKAIFRLEFLPDNMQIDWIGINFEGRENWSTRQVYADDITNEKGEKCYNYLSLIHSADDNYLLTNPGDNYKLRFSCGDVPTGMNRSYYVKSQGYYIEWLRNSWIRNTPKEFALDESMIREAAALWLQKKNDYESRFFNSKLSLNEGGTK